MKTLTPDRFVEFFQALHGHPPYPWQQRLAEQTFSLGWPGAIDLPTGSGKTACIDIAIFALACQASLPVEQRNAPRRVFFCVNRRVIVDEAHTRARSIARKIWEAERIQTNGDSILHDVAAALRAIAGSSTRDNVPPVDVLELRGGIYRDNRWARSITQPTIICTTLDQLGSRLLFRGYGVSTNAAPIQAALIAYDSLILLDEAHISEPFRQTLDYVRSYLDPARWAEQPLGIHPVIVVPMTATPNEDMIKRGVIQLSDDDRNNARLLARLSASKPAELRSTKNIAKDATELAQSLRGNGPTSIGIIVNRIATAKEIYDNLRSLQSESNEKKRKVSRDATIELVIGSMRPIDRDLQAQRLRKIVGPGRPAVSEKQSFIIATQCLEVGADYDFDVLITECASIDALRQRFGRLNRAGRDIDAAAFILANQRDIRDEDKLDDEKPSDPIYGNALARTWHWLNENANESIVDFGIDAFADLVSRHTGSGQPPCNLLSPSAMLNAPVMMPAYLDFWCQTSPSPAPDPNVSLFIHGTQHSEPDVQVCWRADLTDDNDMGRDHWCDVVALLAPSSAECMSVPISRVRRWLADKFEDSQDYADTLGTAEAEDDNDGNRGKVPPQLRHGGVLWRGASDSVLISSPDDLRPGDTLVLPASNSGSRVLGHLPSSDHENPATCLDATAESQNTAISDVAETAWCRTRDQAVLRLHPSLRSTLPAGESFDALFTHAVERDESDRPDWSALLQAAAIALTDVDPTRSASLLHLAKIGFRIESYPDQRGVILTGRKRLGSSTDWFIPAMDDGDDNISHVRRDTPVLLDDHTAHVRTMVGQSLESLPMQSLTNNYLLAAELHDLGKADERFQAMLRQTDRTDAWLLSGIGSALLGKSPGVPQSRAQRQEVRNRAGLPAGFRHEMLSVQIAQLSGQLPDNDDHCDLILHLIAAHHGYARPFAPVVLDDELPAVEVGGIAMSHDQRLAIAPAHRLDSGISERFWLLTRRFGWWGLAYLEAVLRLADQQASAAEEQGMFEQTAEREIQETSA